MMKISARFVVNALALMAGVFLVVVSMAVGAGVLGWLGFAVSTGVLLTAVTGMQITQRADARVAHGALGIVALWSLIAALVFTGPVLAWLVFADAVAVALVALIDLAVHESVTERVVHELDVRQFAPTT